MTLFSHQKDFINFYNDKKSILLYPQLGVGSTYAISWILYSNFGTNVCFAQGHLINDLKKKINNFGGADILAFINPRVGSKRSKTFLEIKEAVKKSKNLIVKRSIHNKELILNIQEILDDRLVPWSEYTMENPI